MGVTPITRRIISLYLIIIFCFVQSIANASESDSQCHALNGGFRAGLVLDGLSDPWGGDFISETELLLTEKKGNLKLIALSNDDVKPTIKKISGIPNIKKVGQGGFLDVKRSPNFSEDRTIYFTYVDKVIFRKAYYLKLAKAKLRKDNQLTDWKVIFTSNKPSAGGRHFGSRIAFAEGYIFFSMGDRGNRESAQNLSIHSGSVFRLHLDGSIPSDNPFVAFPKAQAEIWSYGHRNPQGLFYHSATQELWSNEHGPQGGDEINLIIKGANYGWPIIGYGNEYGTNQLATALTRKEGMEQPKIEFTPSIAPSSLLIYSGKKHVELKGYFLSGALKLRHINVTKPDKNASDPTEFEETRWFEEAAERVRNIFESPSGDIYWLTDSGKLFILLPC